MLDLQKLRVFLRVSDAQTFSQAATALGTTQPTVSRMISELEQALGGRLFYRTGRGIVLSEFGQFARAQAEALMLHADQVSDELKCYNQSPTGVVSFGLPYSMVTFVVPQLVKELGATAPGIRLRILEGFTDQIERWLSTGEVDVAIGSRYANGRNVDRSVLFGSYLRLAGPPGVPPLPPQTRFLELERYPLVLPGHPNRLRTNFEATARRLRITLTVVADTDSIETQKRVCEHCGCYMIVAPPTLPAGEGGEGYSTSLIVRPTTFRYVELITTHQKPLSRAARAVAFHATGIMKAAANAG